MCKLNSSYLEIVTWFLSYLVIKNTKDLYSFYEPLLEDLGYIYEHTYKDNERYIIHILNFLNEYANISDDAIDLLMDKISKLPEILIYKLNHL